MTATTADNVQQTTSGTGTGNLTLSVLNGRQTFYSAFGSGVTPDVFYYFVSSAVSAEWEVGTGHLSDAATLVRDNVQDGSNGTSKVNFSAGLKYVCSDLPSSQQLAGANAATSLGSILINVKTDYNAKGNNSANDAAAIQAAIDACSAAGGGIVFFPPGIYKVTSTVIVKSGVRLVGSGRNITYISGFVTNVGTVTFSTSVARGTSIEDMTVLGYYNANPALVTTDAITIPDVSPVDLIRVVSWYGSAGLNTSGIDGLYHDCWFNGCNDSVVSHGANWYDRVILNGNGSFASCRYALNQTTPAVGVTSLENLLLNCDFSGTFTEAVHIDCSHGVALQCITKFIGCVVGAPINILKADSTLFSACEIGYAPTLDPTNGGFIGIGGASWGSTPMVLSGNVKVDTSCINIYGPAPYTYMDYAPARYYMGAGANPNTGTVALSANTIYFVPFEVRKATTWTKIGAEVTTAAAAGKSIRLAIYSNSGGLPRALLLDAGTVLADTTGIKEITIGDFLDVGIYWLAIQSDGTPTVRSAGSNATMFAFLGQVTLDSSTYILSATFTFAAYPGSITFGSSGIGAATWSSAATALPVIYMRMGV